MLFSNITSMKQFFKNTLNVIALLCTSGFISAAEVYIPRTKVHFKCLFPDGSYTEYKEREKWYFYATPIPHAQDRAPLDSVMKYIDTKGKTHKYMGTWDSRCIGVGKRDGRFFSRSGFQDLQGNFAHFDISDNAKGVVSPDFEKFAKRIPATPDQSPEARQFMQSEFLYADIHYVVPLKHHNHLLFEEALTAFKHTSIQSETVLYVYQSTSSDYGKTWSAPIITKDAKLFEIGRLLTEQSWSAKVKTIVKHR
jgi:hypothetical protein